MPSTWSSRRTTKPGELQTLPSRRCRRRGRPCRSSWTTDPRTARPPWQRASPQTTPGSMSCEWPPIREVGGLAARHPRFQHRPDRLHRRRSDRPDASTYRRPDPPGPGRRVRYVPRGSFAAGCTPTWRTWQRRSSAASGACAGSTSVAHPSLRTHATRSKSPSACMRASTGWPSDPSVARRHAHNAAGEARHPARVPLRVPACTPILCSMWPGLGSSLWPASGKPPSAQNRPRTL